MSFDLYFLERRPGGSWDDALAALEGGDEGRAFGPDEESRWVAVEAAFRSLIPGAEVFVGDDHRELSDLETGLQLSMSPGEISLNVPYWYEGGGWPVGCAGTAGNRGSGCAGSGCGGSGCGGSGCAGLGGVVIGMLS